MNKKMYVILVVLGLVLLIAGLFGLFSSKSQRGAVHERASLVETPISTPEPSLSENERKGQQFEDYIISRFASADYDLVEKVNDYTSRHHATERSKYADLVFRKRATGEQFAVECKYRSGWSDYNGKSVLMWVEQHKIDDYNRFSEERNIDVIVVFGVGGSAAHPDEVFALPLRLLQKPLPQNQAFLRKFAVADGHFEYNARQHNLNTMR